MQKDDEGSDSNTSLYAHYFDPAERMRPVREQDVSGPVALGARVLQTRKKGLRWVCSISNFIFSQR